MTHARAGVPHLVLLALTAALAACGSGGSPSAAAPVGSAPPPPPPPPVARSGDAWQGRYVGTVKIGSTDYFGDALLTADGAVRLYVGAAPYSNFGGLQLGATPDTRQLVGSLSATQQGGADGEGQVLGLDCSAGPGAYCDSPGQATLSVSIATGDLEGEVTVTGSAGSESWSLKLQPWTNYYQLPATPGGLAGTYKEDTAEFAVGGDTLISVDAQGKVSFQSPHSGCSGAGTMQPHPTGAVNVYDVTLTVTGCVAPFDQLNAQYQGLATSTPGDYWAYDSWLRMWLSRANAAGASPALATLGEPQY